MILSLPLVVTIYNLVKILNSPSRFNPGIGVGVFILHQNRILLGQRKDSGLFGLPGGWLEMGETWEDCASRELNEETGLDMSPECFKHISTMNCKCLSERFHNVSLVMLAEIPQDEFFRVRNREPKKCLGWEWVDFDCLRNNAHKLFLPLKEFLGENTLLSCVDDLKKMIKEG